MDLYKYNRGSDRDGGGRGSGRGRGRGRNYQNQQSGNFQQQLGGYQRGGGGWRNNQNPPPVHQWEPRPVQDQGGAHPPPGGRGRATTGRTWGPTPRPGGDAHTQTQIQTSQLATDLQSLEVSEKQPPRSLAPQGSIENVKMPITRPDRGGTVAVRLVRLLVNHFPVKFNPTNTIIHYDVEIKQESSSQSRFLKKIPKSVMALIREKLCADNASEFPLLMTAYDGEKNIFSAVPLPTGSFNVQLSDNEEANGRSYVLSIKFVNEVKLSKLRDYLSRDLVHIPRDILQGLDIVMKENSSKHMVSVGRSMYSREYRSENDLGCGVAAFKGFQQSLKPTIQGLVMCLDYSVIAFRKHMPVIEFLKEHIRGFQGVGDVARLRREVTRALTGLKVTVTHRRTKQKYTIGGLTDKNTRYLTFDKVDEEGQEEPIEVLLIDYFRETHDKDILYKDIPCLDVGKNKKKPNYLPMEFCILADDKRFPNEYLDKNAGILLKDLSLIPPKARKSAICEMVNEEYGPHGGEVTQNFELEVDNNMTRVQGRVIPPPNLKLGGKTNTTVVDKDKCHWNLVGKSVVQGKQAMRWALIDFSSQDRNRYNRLNLDHFIPRLMHRCRNLGVHMEEPLVVRYTDMNELSNVYRLGKLFESVMEEASSASDGGRLQIIICAMTGKDDGYKNIKWVSETQIGVITQCFLTSTVNKGNDKFLDQYLANLALKINAKLGGSNVELIDRLPLLEKNEDHVMFIGADVNHPAPSNKMSPSIAAVVATVNWPAANRYAARVAPQKHRKEEITNFGSMCLDLVNTYARLNKVRPNKIVVFRDGVSDAQFDMVLNKELVDLKLSLYEQQQYCPTITVVVAQKRHLTRLFLENENDGVRPGNIPPGTVVDTTIVHPFEFDFFLCSHFGGLGTSKATHYTVIWDEHNYTSDQMQKLIYSLCFTFARCTKPVSLVPPVYYADLVAYRGRMFQEAAEQQSPASTSSSSSWGASSSSSSFMSVASSDICKLHPELENFMFFV